MHSHKRRFTGLVCLLLFVSSFFLPSAFSKEPDVLDEILTEKIASAANLVVDATVTGAVQSQNKKWSGLSKTEIDAMDKQWTGSKPGDDYDRDTIQGFMASDCARSLIEFQKVNPDFSEIFVTDKKGLNVCQTNKTSDFYQADEEWWAKAYAEGKGLSYFGKIEYDDSAQSQSIPIYLPIRDLIDGSVIGVCKAVIGLSSLVDEL